MKKLLQKGAQATMDRLTPSSSSIYRHTADPQTICGPATNRPTSVSPQRASAPTISSTFLPHASHITRSWYVSLDSTGNAVLTEQPLNDNTRDLRTFVRLYVGLSPHATSFDLHRDIACRHSPVLEEAFKNIIPGDRMHEYHLNCPEIDETIVMLLIYWFYAPKISHVITMDIVQSIPGRGRKTAVLAKLWVLAETLVIPSLQNQIVLEIENLRKKENFTATFALRYVCNNTARNSKLRALMRDQCLWNLKRTWLRDHTMEFPTDMLVEMIEVLQVCVERVPVRDMKDYLIDIVDEGGFIEDSLVEDVEVPKKVVTAEVKKDDGELDWNKVFPNGV